MLLDVYKNIIDKQRCFWIIGYNSKKKNPKNNQIFMPKYILVNITVEYCAATEINQVNLNSTMKSETLFKITFSGLNK